MRKQVFGRPALIGCIGLIFLLVNLSVAFAIQDDEKVSLQWKLKKGDQLELQFDQTQNLVTRIEERDRALDTVMVLNVDWNVTEVDSQGNASIEQVIRRIQIRTGSPGAAIKKLVDIDTDGSGLLRGISRDVFKQIKTLVGAKFFLQMTPTGELLEFRADDSVVEVVDAFPESSTALKGIFQADTLKRMIEQSVLVLPDKAVSSGETWEAKAKISLAANDSRTYEIDRSTLATLDSISNGEASINVTIEMDPPKNLSGDPDTSMTSAIELSSDSSKGRVVFDVQRGVVKSSKISSEITTRVVYRTDQVKTTVKTTSQLTVN